MEIADTLMTETKSTVNTNECNVDDFVTVMYDGMVYVAQVQEIDTEDGEYQIFFMEKVKELYRWPRAEDILWVTHSDIIGKIDEPQQTGKFKEIV